MQMSDKSKHYAAHARTGHRAAILGVLVLVMGFGAAEQVHRGVRQRLLHVRGQHVRLLLQEVAGRLC